MRAGISSENSSSSKSGTQRRLLRLRCRRRLRWQLFVAAVAHRAFAAAFAGAEPDLLRFFCLPLNRPEFRHFVRAVAKRLRLRAAAGTPPIAFAGFDIDRNRRTAADFGHDTHSGPPAGVASQASPQAFASSRTRRM